MGLLYVARCGECHKVASAVVADTQDERDAAAKDVKTWKEKGWTVDLETVNPGDPPPKWCKKGGSCRMTKQEFRRQRVEVLRMTQAELGGHMGMTGKHVGRIETERGPTKEHVAALKLVIRLKKGGLL